MIELNGGVTVLHDMEGGWRDDEFGSVINEKTAIVYSFLDKEDAFINGFPKIIAFINEFRLSTRQKEVMIEFLDGTYRRAYKIKKELSG